MHVFGVIISMVATGQGSHWWSNRVFTKMLVCGSVGERGVIKGVVIELSRSRLGRTTETLIYNSVNEVFCVGVQTHATFGGWNSTNVIGHRPDQVTFHNNA